MPLLEPFPPWLVVVPLDPLGLPPVEEVPAPELPPSWSPPLVGGFSRGSHSPAAEQDWPAGQSRVDWQGLFCIVLEEQERRGPRKTAASGNPGNVFCIRRPHVPHDGAFANCNGGANQPSRSLGSKEHKSVQ